MVSFSDVVLCSRFRMVCRRARGQAQFSPSPASPLPVVPGIQFKSQSAAASILLHPSSSQRFRYSTALNLFPYAATRRCQHLVLLLLLLLLPASEISAALEQEAVSRWETSPAVRSQSQAQLPVVPTTSFFLFAVACCELQLPLPSRRPVR